MDQRISMVTLGVRRLAAARRFYERGLGWRASPVSSSDQVIFRAGCLLVGFVERGSLAADLGLDDHGDVFEFSGIALTHTVASREDAILVLARAEAAGGVITKGTSETPWGGFAGCFCDPDGHAWDIAWNPDWFDEKGRLLIA